MTTTARGRRNPSPKVSFAAPSNVGGAVFVAPLRERRTGDTPWRRPLNSRDRGRGYLRLSPWSGAVWGTPCPNMKNPPIPPMDPAL